MIRNYSELENIIVELNSYISKEQGKRERIQEQIEENNKVIKQIDNQIELNEKVVVLLQKTSEFARNQAKLQINPWLQIACNIYLKTIQNSR